MQSTVRIFRSCSTTTAAWRHRREICIYQAGATNISFIICSERLICSPRRAASTCPPPVDPPRGPLLSRCPLSLSVRVEPRHAPFYPSLPRRLKLIPNNACKSLGKCTSRVKTAPPSAGNGGHSIFVQRCFRRCAMERSTQLRKFALSALTIRDYQAGSFRRPPHALQRVSQLILRDEGCPNFFRHRMAPLMPHISHFALQVRTS